MEAILIPMDITSLYMNTLKTFLLAFLLWRQLLWLPLCSLEDSLQEKFTLVLKIMPDSCWRRRGDFPQRLNWVLIYKPPSNACFSREVEQSYQASVVQIPLPPLDWAVCLHVKHWLQHLKYVLIIISIIIIVSKNVFSAYHDDIIHERQNML